VTKASRRRGRPSAPSGVRPWVGGIRCGPIMPAPPAFTDEQIDAIMRAAAPLAPDDRAAFVEEVLAALDGKPLGDGAVFSAIREVQGRYLDAPKWGVR